MAFLILKSLVHAHQRRLPDGRIIQVAEHQDRRTRKASPAAASPAAVDPKIEAMLKLYAGDAEITPDELREAVRQYRDVESANAEVLRANKEQGQPLPAPNGKPSNLNRNQWVLVRTPNFKRWFGDWESGAKDASKVVDANGEPMVVYHGTSEDFSVFDRKRLGENTLAFAEGEGWGQTSRIGFWFNTQPMGRSPEKYGAGYNLDMPVFLSIKAPRKEPSIDQLAGRVSWHGGSGVSFKNRLKRDGFDGVVVKDEEFGGTSYVALGRVQIKSAIGNAGTFRSDLGSLNKALLLFQLSR